MSQIWGFQHYREIFAITIYSDLYQTSVFFRFFTQLLAIENDSAVLAEPRRRSEILIIKKVSFIKNVILNIVTIIIRLFFTKCFSRRHFGHCQCLGVDDINVLVVHDSCHYCCQELQYSTLEPFLGSIEEKEESNKWVI